ncbi:hypothetical protein [Rummeliibacillus stabekisii]|uniref:hypothetical protein n=1 Tax=Rummeliibacillus stabekisii TaxID=241244 RepID=UPI001168C125|nr:hypothetical protein [Rummeliibacillus stabekisii]MBB5171559.1 hypothetical protein [Rummeliibacillus stabekisii]GEL05527.1 hypothetical protein RST01_21540 [Rummeliibacillus stabekisii]
MTDVLLLIAIAIGGWIFIRIMLKEPILPWKEKKPKKNSNNKQIPKSKKKSKKTKKDIEEENPLNEKEAAPFQDLFPDVVSIENHMIRRLNNHFTMIAEVEPVNYFLLDQSEQEAIDMGFETWLSQFNYPVRIYLQNRFVDLAIPIEEIQKVMAEQEDLYYEARDFGLSMIRNLKDWQASQPRYETKRYILFDYHVEAKDLKAESNDELEEKIIEKAFSELNRRVSAARQQLKKAEMPVFLLTTEGIGEVLYYAFNRRKAIKNRFNDIHSEEQLALYVTADQGPEHIAFVKGEIEKNAQAS